MAAPFTAPSQRLTTAGAREVLATAIRAAAAEGMHVCAVVCDSGGHIMAVERMDRAPAHTVHSATTKAACAASMRRTTGAVSMGIGMDYGFGIALAAGAERWTPLPGGAPIVVDGECIGAVGIAGAPGEVDERIAESAANALG